MQHGSYQLVRADEQPLLRSGEVVLYRGVQKSGIFRFQVKDKIWVCIAQSQESDALCRQVKVKVISGEFSNNGLSPPEQK